MSQIELDLPTVPEFKEANRLFDAQRKANEDLANSLMKPLKTYATSVKEMNTRRALDALEAAQTASDIPQALANYNEIIRNSGGDFTNTATEAANNLAINIARQDTDRTSIGASKALAAQNKLSANILEDGIHDASARNKIIDVQRRITDVISQHANGQLSDADLLKSLDSLQSEGASYAKSMYNFSPDSINALDPSVKTQYSLGQRQSMDYAKAARSNIITRGTIDTGGAGPITVGYSDTSETGTGGTPISTNRPTSFYTPKVKSVTPSKTGGYIVDGTVWSKEQVNNMKSLFNYYRDLDLPEHIAKVLVAEAGRETAFSNKSLFGTHQDKAKPTQKNGYAYSFMFGGRAEPLIKKLQAAGAKFDANYNITNAREEFLGVMAGHAISELKQMGLLDKLLATKNYEEAEQVMDKWLGWVNTKPKGEVTQTGINNGFTRRHQSMAMLEKAFPTQGS